MLTRQLYGAGEPGAIELGDQAQNLLGQVDGAWIGRRVQLVECLLYPVTGGPEVLRLGHRSVLRRPGLRSWPLGWGSASSSAPCPCPGTCAPRRAGTGRSCGRPA